MILIIISLFVALLFYLQTIVKDKISRFFAISVLVYWFGALALSTTNINGLFEVSNVAYLLLLLNVISFVLGFLVIKIPYKNEKRVISLKRVVNKRSFNYLVMVGIILALYLLYTKQTSMAFNNADYAQFRADFFELLFEGNTLLLYTYYLFLYPLHFFLSAVVAYMLFFYRKWRLILLYLLYVIPFMTLSEGRSHYLIFGLIILLNYTIYREKGKKARLKMKYIFNGVVIALAIFIAMANATSNRSNTSLEEGAKDLSATFISYSISPFRAFDYALNHDYVGKAGGYQYGRASFCGFDYLISSVMKRFGIRFTSSREITNSYLQNNTVPVSAKTSINYSFTNAIYHYYDLGIIGVFLFPFMFGLFCRYVIKKFYSESSLPILALLSFVYFIAMHTVFSWYFNKLFTVPYIAVLLILHNRNRKSISLTTNA